MLGVKRFDLGGRPRAAKQSELSWKFDIANTPMARWQGRQGRLVGATLTNKCTSARCRLQLRVQRTPSYQTRSIGYAMQGFPTELNVQNIAASRDVQPRAFHGQLNRKAANKWQAKLNIVVPSRFLSRLGSVTLNPPSEAEVGSSECSQEPKIR